VHYLNKQTVYLYYRSSLGGAWGELRVAVDLPGPEWLLADAERVPREITPAVRTWIQTRARRLPLLPVLEQLMEEGE